MKTKSNKYFELGAMFGATLVGAQLWSAIALPTKWRSRADFYAFFARMVAPDPVDRSACPEIIAGNNHFILSSHETPYVIPAEIKLETKGLNPPSIDPAVVEAHRSTAQWVVDRGLPSSIAPTDNEAVVSPTSYPSIFRTFLDFEGHVQRGFGLDLRAGLPASSSEFGERTVTAYTAGSILDTAKIGLFYESSGTDHPEGGPASFTGAIGDPEHNSYVPIKSPNWFYYYSQALPGTMPVEYVNDSSGTEAGYTPTGLAGLIWPFLHIVIDPCTHIGASAHGTKLRCRFELDGNGKWQLVGLQQAIGIDYFMGTVIHEGVHRQVYESYNSCLANDNCDDDDDHDGLPNDLEDAMHLDSQNANTTQFDKAFTIEGGRRFESGVGYGSGPRNSFDFEVIAQIAGQGVLGSRSTDWADDGLNVDTCEINRITNLNIISLITEEE